MLISSQTWASTTAATPNFLIVMVNMKKDKEPMRLIGEYACSCT